VWGVPYALGLWWITHVHQPWGWPGLIAEMSLAALGFLVLSGAAILSPTDRALWRLRLLGLRQLMRGGAGRTPTPTPASVPSPAVESNESTTMAPASLAAQPDSADHNDDGSARR
jgi:hypothetical protein